MKEMKVSAIFGTLFALFLTLGSTAVLPKQVLALSDTNTSETSSLSKITRNDITNAKTSAESAIKAVANIAELNEHREYLQGWVNDAKTVLADDLAKYDHEYLNELVAALNEGAKALGYLANSAKITDKVQSTTTKVDTPKANLTVAVKVVRPEDATESVNTKMAANTDAENADTANSNSDAASSNATETTPADTTNDDVEVPTTGASSKVSTGLAIALGVASLLVLTGAVVVIKRNR